MPFCIDSCGLFWTAQLGRIDDFLVQTSEQFPANSSALQRASHQSGGKQDKLAKTFVAGRRRSRVGGIYPRRCSGGASILDGCQKYRYRQPGQRLDQSYGLRDISIFLLRLDRASFFRLRVRAQQMSVERALHARGFSTIK